MSSMSGILGVGTGSVITPPNPGTSNPGVFQPPNPSATPIVNTAAPAGAVLSSISEFFAQLMYQLKFDMYTGVYNKIAEQWVKLNEGFTQSMGNISNLLTTDITSFAGGTPFQMAMQLANIAFVPVAGVIFAFCFGLEISHIAAETNTNGENPIYKVLTSLVKLAICLLVITHALDICVFCFRLGMSVTSKIGSVNTTGGMGGVGNLADYVKTPVEGMDISFGDIIGLLGVNALVGISRICMFALFLFILFKVIVWFVELIIFMAPAAIPMSTWVNKQWSAVGENYLKRMLALSFEGPMMLFIFAIYGSLYGVISTTAVTGDLMTKLAALIGGSFVIYFSISKISSITSSMFNAH